MAQMQSRRRFLGVCAAAAAGAAGTAVLTACAGATGTTSATASPVTKIEASTVTAARAVSAPSTTSVKIVTTTSASAPPATSVAAKGLTLAIASWLAQPPSLQAYTLLAEGYAKVQPNVRVEHLLLANPGYATKLTTLLASDTPPDLAETDWGTSQALGTKGALQPLDALIARDKIDFKEYAQEALELGRWPQQTGKYHAWYTMFAVGLLFYNTALFQAAGEPPPDATWTWQHLLDVAQKLTKPGTGPADAQYGFTPAYFTRSMLYSFGWDFASPDLSQCLLDSADSLTALQFWQDLIYKYQVTPPPGSDFAKGVPFTPFASKRVGMNLDGAFTVGQLRTVQGLAWDIAPPPKGPKGQFAVIKGAPGYSLPAQSPHATEAWAFLSWWIRNQTPELVTLPGNLPSKLSALSGWTTQQKQQSAVPAHIDLIPDIVTKYGKPVQVLPNNDVVKKPYYTERALTLQNKEDVKTGMTKACQQMLALMKQ